MGSGIFNHTDDEVIFIFFIFLKLTNMFVEVQITEALSLIKEIINFFIYLFLVTITESTGL